LVVEAEQVERDTVLGQMAIMGIIHLLAVYVLQKVVVVVLMTVVVGMMVEQEYQVILVVPL
jgi:uncharacterized membrane protein (Fun14 family)